MYYDLIHILQVITEILPLYLYRISKTIRVKLTADWTNIGKQIHCVVVAFTLLDCISTVGSVDGMVHLYSCCPAVYSLFTHITTMYILWFLHRCSSYRCLSRWGEVPEPEAGNGGHLRGGEGPRASHTWRRNIPGTLHTNRCLSYHRKTFLSMAYTSIILLLRFLLSPCILDRILLRKRLEVSGYGYRHWCSLLHLCVHLVQVPCSSSMGHLQAVVLGWPSWQRLTYNCWECGSVSTATEQKEVQYIQSTIISYHSIK